MARFAPGSVWFARHWPVFVLLVLAVALRGWQWRNAPVISRDGIAFTRYAWQLDHEPWTDVLNRANRHPGYPVAVLAASYPVRVFMPGPPAALFQTSAQLVSFLSGVLLVLPLYALGRELIGRRGAFVACLLVFSLPAASEVMVDAVSEPLFLLLAVTSLWSAVRALRTYRPSAFAMCGAFAGLAYLVRPEGLVVAAAAGVALVAAQFVRVHRRPWRVALTGAVCLVLAVIVTGGPLVAATGKLTVKPSGAKFWGESACAEPRATVASAALFAVWQEDAPERGGMMWAMRAVGRELVEATFFWLWVPALAGLWLSRGRGPGAWVPFIVAAVMLALAWRVASTSGYLSKRHLLLVAIPAAYWAAAALVEVASRVRLRR